ncbi:sulfite exporter TauE/SafE family protein [Thiomicrorhabdus sp.]|uniref:sulfite exporter TauE/SafE family protein n=1 Tax=Thiomicrorhabdus sp. TaxID=2039724 RepID=UPI002AA5FEFC|nr:sulfite exporter TauE/SafE family protein [Thiomicrorhabdus sp.]
MESNLLMEYLPLLLSLMATGVVGGLLAGLLGVGGGIVIVPVLYFVFQGLGMGNIEAMSLATGTSLATIIPTSISSIRAHNSKGNVDWSLIQKWWFWLLFGVVLGGYLISIYKSSVFIVLFALIAGFVSLRMLFSKNASVTNLPGLVMQRTVASVIGFLSVMIGIGGGTLGVPVLSKFNFVTHRAVGTAAVFGLIIALPGAGLMLVLGSVPENSPIGTYGAVNLPSLLAIIPLTILFAPIGVKLGQKLNAVTLKKVFAVVLLITSVRMFTQALGV